MGKDDLLKTLNQKFRFLMDRNRVNEALATAKEYISIDPDDGIGYYLMAIALNYLNLYDEALVQINRALSLNPNDSDFHLYQGVIYHCTNNFTEAKKSYEAAIRLSPEVPSYYIHLARVHLSDHKFEMAEEMARKALSINARSEKAYYILGRIALHQEKYDQAESFFREALNIDPLYDEALIGLGNLHIKKVDYKEGMSVFLSILRRYPNSVSARTGLLTTFRFTFKPYRYYENILHFIRRSKVLRLVLTGIFVFLLLNAKIIVLAPIIFVPVVFLLMVILMMGILTFQMTNVLLMLHPMARNALTKKQFLSGIWILFHSLSIIVLFVLLLIAPSVNLFLHFIFAYSSLFVVSVIFNSNLKNAVIGVMVLILLLGTVGYIFYKEDTVFSYFFGIYSLLFILIFLNKMFKFLKGKTDVA